MTLTATIGREMTDHSSSALRFLLRGFVDLALKPVLDLPVKLDERQSCQQHTVGFGRNVHDTERQGLPLAPEFQHPSRQAVHRVASCAAFTTAG